MLSTYSGGLAWQASEPIPTWLGPSRTPYRLQIPIALEDRDMIASAARRAGTTMTNWCRETLVANARAVVDADDGE